jgi:4-hydroxythreonine-4-phosphate dehydrogenase
MMFVCDNLRVILVTRHIPLKEVSAALTTRAVYNTIQLAHAALKDYFGLKNSLITVCGLNPHAGEGGTIGREEIRHILPAIQQAQRRGMKIEGPFAADTLFSPQMARRYDAVVTMYHDQGLIPIKTQYFTKPVNLTVGLPFVRTSPAHGTAFDIAGQDKADASSMTEAISLAVRLAPPMAGQASMR